MDWQTHIAETVERFVKLGEIPGARDYAWAKMKEMEAHHPDLYADLPELVRQAAREKANAAEKGQ